MDQLIVTEIIRRWKLLIANATPDDISTGMDGSETRFNAALALIGDPFINPPAWKDPEYLKPAMTKDEFYSGTYDELLTNLFKLAYDKVNNINKKPQSDFDEIINNTANYLAQQKLNRKIEREQYEQRYKDWMKDFQDPPKQSKKYLEKEIIECSKQLQRCKPGGSLPPFAAGQIQDRLERYMLDLRNENYIKTKQDEDYNKRWHSRNNEFYKNYES